MYSISAIFMLSVLIQLCDVINPHMTSTVPTAKCDIECFFCDMKILHDA